MTDVILIMRTILGRIVRKDGDPLALGDTVIFRSILKSASHLDTPELVCSLSTPTARCRAGIFFYFGSAYRYIRTILGNKGKLLSLLRVSYKIRAVVMEKNDFESNV